MAKRHEPEFRSIHISETRINERIRVPEVRLVGPDGEQVGIVRVEDALRLAQEADLDLVEVSANSRPPVCKLMDFGKWKYEADVKARESRKNQASTVLKTIRLRLKIDPHDYETKKGQAQRFLEAGDKVKLLIMFRGRERSRPEMGIRLLQRISEDLAEYGVVESSPMHDGSGMVMVLGPVKRKQDVKTSKPSQAERRAAKVAKQQEAQRKQTEAEQRKAEEAAKVENTEVAELLKPLPQSAQAKAPASKPAGRAPGGKPAGKVGPPRPASRSGAGRPPAGKAPGGSKAPGPRSAPGSKPAGGSKPASGSKPGAGSKPAAARPAAGSRPDPKAGAKPATGKPAAAKSAPGKPGAKPAAGKPAPKPAAAKPAGKPLGAKPGAAKPGGPKPAAAKTPKPASESKPAAAPAKPVSSESD